MIQLANTITAWGRPEFAKVFQHEVQQLGVDQLPLQQALRYGNQAVDCRLQAMLLKAEEIEQSLMVKAGIFFCGIVAGCSCSDDVGTDDVHNEYCEMLFHIDRHTATTTVSLLPD